MNGRAIARFAVALAFGLVGACTAPRAVEPEPTEEQRAVFALLDEFGPRPLPSWPFVGVTSNPRTREAPWFGWLVRADGNRIEIRGIDLASHAFDARTHSFACRDPGEVLAETCRMRAAKAGGASDFEDCPGLDLLLLARAAFHHGRYAAVRAAWPLILAAHQPVDYLRGPYAHLPYFLADRTAEQFADATLSWQDLRQRHEAFLREFGASSWAREVRLRHAAIVRHIEEQATRADLPADSPERLVFALRDEFELHPEAGSLGPGLVDPPCGFPEPTPARRLIEAGVRVVPVLLAARSDKSLTRGVQTTRFGGCFQPWTVGALAEMVLVRIAGFVPKDWDAWAAVATTAGLDAALEADASRGHWSALEAWYRRHPEDIDKVMAWGKSLDLRYRASLLLRAAPDPVPPKVVEEAYRALESVRGFEPWEVSLQRLLEKRGVPVPPGPRGQGK